MTTIARRVSELMADAWYAEDAEAAGANAAKLLADRETTLKTLGGPLSVAAARHAVIQRFGGVGALLVVACEDAVAKTASTASTASRAGTEVGATNRGAAGETSDGAVPAT
ncbi:MAG: hypothetical protein ACRDV4_11740, partial [Acidimicrobiales bacterium]